MKTDSKKFIVRMLTVFVLMTVIILVYVGLKLETDSIISEKEIISEKIKAASDKKIALIARYQNLTSADYIKKIATEELGMISNPVTEVSFTISLKDILTVENSMGEE